MNSKNDLYITETDNSVKQFVSDFTETVKRYGFVINNHNSMDMKKTFHEHE